MAKKPKKTGKSKAGAKSKDLDAPKVAKKSKAAKTKNEPAQTPVEVNSSQHSTQLSAPAPSPSIAKSGMPFHASRRSRGFTVDPTGFSTEKDSRGKSSTHWFDLPAPTGLPPYRMRLDSILTPDAMSKITANKRLVFHTVGDTGGVNTTTYQQQVANYMELDFKEDDSDGSNPSFFYHLGDVVYYDGEIKNYYWEFYEPYLHYPAPVFAIPGNHDGDIDPTDQFNSPSDSLKGFVRNFCAQVPNILPEAKDAPRPSMTQPNVFWTLLTPMATVIGLYTNVPEGGGIAQNQIDWFENELEQAPSGLPIILSLHHPIFSAYGHEPGSQPLKAAIESAVEKTGRTPSLILTGHVHDYQRFIGKINGTEVMTLVVGAGGYNQRLHVLSRRQFDPKGCPYTFENGGDSLEAFNDWQHGYLLMEVTETEIIGKYIAIDDPTADSNPDTTIPKAQVEPYDTFTIPLRNGNSVSPLPR